MTQLPLQTKIFLKFLLDSQSSIGLSLQMFIFKLTFLIFIINPSLSVSVSYEAFNISCLNASYITSQSSPIELTLPPYSLVTIIADLRHLDSDADLQGVTLTLNVHNIDTGQEYSQSLALNVSAVRYSLYAAENIALTAQYTITDNTTERPLSRSYLFSKSVSALVTPPEPLDQVQKTFLFVSTQNDTIQRQYISLPYNMVPYSNTQQFSGFFLTQEKQISTMSSKGTTPFSYNDYWSGTFNWIYMPFIPYFSNCQDSGQYLYFSQMIHNASQCDLYGYDSTPINQFMFGSSAKADNCIIKRNCIYDQPLTGHEYPVWSTLDSTSGQLFYVTAFEQEPPYAPFPDQDSQEPKLVPCKIKASEGDNTTLKFPMKTKLTLGYYQSTEQTRQILNCQIQFSLYAQSNNNFEYELEIEFAPLNHTQILLDFGFNWYIYMLVFIVIGLISILQFIIFWLYHICTTVKTKIRIRCVIYLKMIKEIVKGVLFAVVIGIFLTFSVQLLMNGTLFGYSLSLSFNSLWDYMISNNIGYMSDTRLASIRTARMGFSYICISVYLSYHLAHLLIGKERKSNQYEDYEILGQKFKPFEWNRGKFLFGQYLIALCAAGFLFFTYSNFFNDNIWLCIALMQVAQMVLQEILNSLYNDVLPTIPMKLSVGVLTYLATMGAIDLYYFILGYLVDVGISTIERCYLSLIQEKITKFVEDKNQELHKFYINLLNDEEEQNQKKSQQNNSLVNDNEKIMIQTFHNMVELLEEDIIQTYNLVDLANFEQEENQKKVRELFVAQMKAKNQLYDKKDKTNKKDDLIKDNSQLLKQIQNKKFELLTDSAASMVQYLLQPIIVFMLWITYNSSSILSNFQIAYQNCILYLLSSIILAICYQFNIIIIIHVVELYFNFDYKKLIEELLQRFREKKTFWITDQEKWESKIDDLETKSRACNRYCLSSQMFFAVSLYTFLIYLFIMGFTTIISAQFNIFEDPLLVPIIIFWLLVLRLFQWILKKVIYFFDIWDYAKFAQGGNRISEAPEQMPSADLQTQHNILRSSMNSSSIRFTFKQIEPIPKSQQQNVDQRKVLKAKLDTICKKLQPTFQAQDFRLQYAIKNKDFIRQNIEKILPLVESFPENDSHWLGKNETSKELTMKKKEAKNIDPGVSDFVSSWLKRVQANRSRRKEDGIEKERKLKKCNFCFRTWGIYYGYQGICLQCSKKVFGTENHMKEE